MKIWKKIFLYSVTLTMILVNLVGIIMIDKVQKKNLDRVISDTIDIQKNISNSIYLNYDIRRDESIENYDISGWLNIILKNYIYTNQGNIKNIQVFDEDKKVVASLNKYNNGDVNKILESSSNEIIFSIKKVNNERLLLVSSQIKIEDKNYKLILSRSIEFLYEDMSENYKIFIILDIIMNLLLIIGMYVISRHITKPIANLTNTSVEIASGNYSERAIVSSEKDEISILSQNFNLMMEVLESKIKELKDTNDEKERFINNLTHEMKTPITSIIGYSDILLKGNISEDIKLKSLDYINSESKRLENLSSALIKLTLMKNNRIEKELISIKDCINNVNRSLSYKLRQKNIDLNISIEDINIMADKSLIIILFRNLLENSIKACNIDGDIKIIGKLENKAIYNIFIQDNGKGIKKENLEKIMEPFYVVDKARSKKDNGIGLGLAICKEVCNIHDIKINIISKINRGTTIKLTINMEGNQNEKNI